MRHFASDNPPDLFHGIQVRRIWRKIYERDLIDNILINSVEILLNQSFGFSMPWGVVHDHVIFDAVRERIIRQKITNRGDDGFLSEPSGLVDPQFSGGRNDKAAISDALASGRGFDFRTASNQSPNPRHQGCQHKMNLILKDQNRVLLFRYIFRFFFEGFALFVLFGVQGRECLRTNAGEAELMKQTLTLPHAQRNLKGFLNRPVRKP